VHIAAAAAALGLGVLVRLSPPELALLVLTAALVLVVEAVNTCLETLCDLVSPTYHPLVKRAKDVSAAAVLISAVASIAIAALLFVPRLV
jgi:diacylglycerol kinase